jgi:gliding motility-associated-like protein
LNAVYFKFTCRTAGSLAFVIAAWKPEDDLNWQLFDITGKNPNSIFSDRYATIAANWSGTTGPTGASSQGSSPIQCRTIVGQGAPVNTFSSLPQLNENHTYLLMVSNISFTGGFALTIEGGTADISGDIATPLKAETASCNNNQMKLVFSKSVRCSSITATGSEFILQPANATVNGVTVINCGAGDESDSILLNFSQPLSNGNYSLILKSGADGNTIQDNCGNLMAAGTEIKFSISPYPIIDSINIANCRPDKIRLLLSKQTLCNSIAADGSDFIITGPSAIAIASAVTVCTNGTANEIELILQNPITASGTYTVQLKNGTDGSTLTDECNNSTPVSVSKSFDIKGNVDADFTVSITKGCIADTVSFIHAGGNNVNIWSWNFSNNSSSSLKEPVKVFSTGGQQTVSLYVSNGQCFANMEKTFVLDEKLKADFDLPSNACSNQLITIKNKSKAAINYNWDLGNGTQSNHPNPPDQTYPVSTSDKNYTVILTVQNNSCIASISKNILIKANCIISLPNAFTPNNDGLNDLFGPINSFGVTDLRFKVFNRYGQPIFQSNNTVSAWDGTFKSEKQPPGLYSWTLEYKDVLSNQKTIQKGTVFLLR